VLLTVVGDESHDEKEQRVFAVAALMAPEDVWIASEAWWESLMEGEVFHGARFETEFAHDKATDRHKQRLRRYAELAQLVSRCGVVGVGVAIDLAGYRAAFPGTPRESAYLKCFSEVVIALVEQVQRFNKNANSAGRCTEVRFVFDERRKTQFNAALLHAELAHNLQRHNLDLKLHEMVFDSRRNKRIQMADLVARETMKHFDNVVGPIKRPMRGSMRALDQSRRFVFSLLTQEYWEDMLRKMPELHARSGMSVDDYKAWLQERNVEDNWTRRLEYVRWLNERDRQD
jgi:hypothetical protein